MTKHETERLAIVEQKLDTNGKRLADMEDKVDATHDAVLQLPEELQKKFVTRIEFSAVKWVASLIIIGLTVLAFFQGA